MEANASKFEQVLFLHEFEPKSISYPERIISGLYHIGCATVEIVNLVIKVAFAIFASLLAGVCCGKSCLMNHFFRKAVDDVSFSGKMLVIFLKGIYNPLGAFEKEVELRYGFLFEVIVELTKSVEAATTIALKKKKRFFGLF